MQRLLKTAALAMSFVLALSTLGAAKTETRVALVIGNESYVEAADLQNPINDANAIAQELESLGFDVTLGMDLSYNELRDTVRQFTRTASTADLTVFYYAGHGIAVDGENYLVPVDAKLSDPFDWEFEVYSVSEILRLVGRSSGPSLIFLDACRDNPLAAVLAQAQGMSTRSVSSRGLQRIPAETFGISGSVIAYATEPGQVAADGEGQNSPFTEALLTHLSSENTDFATVASLIRGDVIEKTNGAQRPRFDFALNGPLVLNAVAEPQKDPVVETSLNNTATDELAPAQSTDAALKVETLMFETAVASNDIEDYRAFVKAFPNSPFALLATNAINRLSKDESTEELVALADPAPAQPGATRLVALPLTLELTQAARSMPSTAETDNGLFMDYSQRKALQIRLNLAGHNVGTPDADVGPKTRAGITSWQSANGLAPTGFLNAVQHQYLVASTDLAFSQHMAANPNALAAPQVSQSGTKRKKNNANNGIANFVGGVAVGIGLGKILD